MGLPVTHFVDKAFSLFYDAFLQLCESIEAQLIEIVGGWGIRRVILVERGEDGWYTVRSW